MKVLITGFEPWDEHAVNPSGVAARALGGEVLPVDFRRAGIELRRLVRKHRATSLLMLGLAPNRERIELEAVALNVDHHDKEGPNRRWRRPIVKGGAPALESRLPIDEIHRRLQKAGIPAGVSHHAGTFLCNHVFYLGLTLVDGPCGFVHVPPFKALPRERLIQAVRLIAHAAVGWSPEATP